MKIDVSHTTTGGIARLRTWDAAASRDLGRYAHAVVSQRAFDAGRGSDDQLHAAYSTTKTWVSVHDFPRPRGGRLTESGKGRVYGGGYREYKRATLGTPRVNLARTGNMRRKFRLKRATRGEIVIGLTGTAVIYGTFVNRRRRWSALSAKDRAKIHAAVARMSAGAMDRSGRRNHGGA